MRPQSSKSSLFRSIAILLLGSALTLGAVLVYLYEQPIRDWWFLRSYTPSSVIEHMAQDAHLSARGTDLFYVSDPLLADKESFNQYCAFPERTLVLGCYDGQKIYILDVESGSKAEIVEPVTAAHEMLHAAYIRLTNSQRASVNELLDIQFKKVKNQRVLDLVKEYQQHDPNAYHNELHSIFGTELRTLTPELEDYYSDYFSDRSALIKTAEAYEQIFITIEQAIADFDAQLAELEKRIDDNNATLQVLETQMNTQRSELKHLLDTNQIDQYNTLVPQFNRLVGSYNSLVRQTRSLVLSFNDIVAQRNELALEQNDLVQTLDSNYLEVE